MQLMLMCIAVLSEENVWTSCIDRLFLGLDCLYTTWKYKLGDGLEPRELRLSLCEQVEDEMHVIQFWPLTERHR